jgi:uncharacterized protein (TIGR02145 family)
MRHNSYPNTSATNESGFTGLPGGSCENDGEFGWVFGYSCFWWSATEYDTTIAWGLQMNYGLASADRHNDYKKCGFSVRCIKDN